MSILWALVGDWPRSPSFYTFPLTSQHVQQQESPPAATTLQHSPEMPVLVGDSGSLPLTDISRLSPRCPAWQAQPVSS